MWTEFTKNFKEKDCIMEKWQQIMGAVFLDNWSGDANFRYNTACSKF